MAGVVRVVYLVSGDRRVRHDYAVAIWRAVLEVRQWYGRQLEGPTFRLSRGVEILRAEREASWFSDTSAEPHRHLERGLQEVHRLRGALPDDPDNCWIVYSDAPGSKGAGRAGVCVMPLDDLLGLRREHPTHKDVRRWVGGLAHHLGRAMGLRRPSDVTKDRDALMWTGHCLFPHGTYLCDEDKATLLAGSYIEGDGPHWADRTFVRALCHQTALPPTTAAVHAGSSVPSGG